MKRLTAEKARVARTIAMFAAIVLMSACGHREVTGTINTTDFVIPAGEVVTAVGDVTINASRKIEIDGTLYIAPGATVTFQSPSVNVPGSVQHSQMHVGWWRRSMFFLNRVPDAVVARVDRMLGRTPNYWNRGSLDCFSPQGRAAALSSSAPKSSAAAP